MFLQLKQKFHGFIKKYFLEGPANDMSYSTPKSRSTPINGISHSSIKSNTTSSICKPCDWFLAVGFNFSTLKTEIIKNGLVLEGQRHSKGSNLPHNFEFDVI